MPPPESAYGLFLLRDSASPREKSGANVSRISKTFTALKKQNRSAFVPFITAGDPDFETALALLNELPKAGADLIELGIPFSDPMADGPVNQASYLRALASGMTLVKVLEMVRRFPQGRWRDAAGADGIVQPDPRLWHSAVHQGRSRSRHRRISHSRSAAGGR